MVLAAAGLADLYGQPFPKTAAGSLFWVGLGLTVGGGVQAEFRTRHSQEQALQIAKLESANQQLEVEKATAEGDAATAADALVAVGDAVDRSARAILQSIVDVYQFTPQERVSLYRVTGTTVALVARYSLDTVLAQVSPTTAVRSYDLNFGLVGASARTGERQTAAKGPPSTSKVKYRQWQVAHRLHRSLHGEIRMKSRSYDVVPIKAPGSPTVVGVVSLESTLPICAQLSDAGTDLLQPNALLTVSLREVLALTGSVPFAREDPS